LEPLPPNKLILACGNPLRGDDGVGWTIAESIRQDPMFADVKIVVAQQFGPELTDLLRYADIVAFVDASASAIPGEVNSIDVEAASEVPQALSHHLPPACLLALTEYLYGRIPGRAFAVTVGGESFDLSRRFQESATEATLTAAVRAAIPETVDLLREIFTHSH
jgi:hydrogenase maturation protease